MDDIEMRTMKQEFDFLEKKIEEAKRIVVYRHVSPDFDALGAQMGLVTWIEDNFPGKEVHYVGEGQDDLIPSLFPVPEVLDESFYEQEHLAIVVDVSDTKRISDNHIDKAAFVIKIDHHPLPKEEYRYGDYLIVHPDRPAAAEILALFMLSRGGLMRKKRILSQQAASYLYTGIVGDTGRFLYEDTDSATLRIAGDLLDTGFDKTIIYTKMYETDVRQMEILKFCLNNYKLTEKGTCYYVLTKEDMEKLQMSVDEGNLHINSFRSMKGVKCVASVTWDEKNNHYRISLRSQSIKVSPAANKFGGGGHDYAAGCFINTLDELPSFIEACDELEETL